MIHTAGGRAGLHPGDDARQVVAYFRVDDIEAGVRQVRELGGEADEPGACRGGLRPVRRLPGRPRGCLRASPAAVTTRPTDVSTNPSLRPSGTRPERRWIESSAPTCRRNGLDLVGARHSVAIVRARPRPALRPRLGMLGQRDLRTRMSDIPPRGGCDSGRGRTAAGFVSYWWHGGPPSQHDVRFRGTPMRICVRLAGWRSVVSDAFGVCRGRWCQWFVSVTCHRGRGDNGHDNTRAHA